MFQILQPISLLAIAAIAIPVIIHLWNTGKGKTVNVGSILLYVESARQKSLNVRLQDILLLVLRCLLIVLLTFLIAKPTWQKELTTNNQKGWVLLEKESFSGTYKNFKPVIDSLLEKGYNIRYFNKGFEPVSLETGLKTITGGEDEHPFPYWSLLKQLDREVPSGVPVYLFTGNKLKRFAGTRPLVHINLHWRTYTDTAPSSVVKKAYLANGGGVRIITGHSTPVATWYTFENTGTKDTHGYNFANNKVVATGSPGDASNTDTVTIDTSTLRVVIYADPFSEDAGYVRAAIEAVRDYTGLQIKVSIVNSLAGLKEAADWIFWLSEKSLPLLPASRSLVYEKGKVRGSGSWITNANSFAVNTEPVNLYRSIENNTVHANSIEPVWQDGFGRAILTLEKTNKYTYHFYSRFNPAWNDLPYSAQFADMLFHLLVPTGGVDEKYDNRIIDESQLQPRIEVANRVYDQKKLIVRTDLSKVFWIVAFVVFCIERYLSLTRNNRAVYAGTKA